MQSAATLVWITRQAHAECVREATLFYPRETGGTFMGYWSASGDEVVITRLIAAGPRAFRARAAFEPDHQWQLGEIASHYCASGRREMYLGDWHSHPDAASGELSGTDRRVLRRIIRTPKARAARPISLVFWCGPGRWRVSAWIATLTTRKILPACLLVLPAELQLYEAALQEAPANTATESRG
jgi:integrative and conjugative element protein (TIGR02256 family)